nr:MAG TPA_asm: hypothetical protein [Caudoviricetes sp.]
MRRRRTNRLSVVLDRKVLCKYNICRNSAAVPTGNGTQKHPRRETAGVFL